MASKLSPPAIVLAVGLILGLLWWPRPAAQPPGAAPGPRSTTAVSNGAGPGDATAAAMPALPEVQRDAAPPVPASEPSTAVSGAVQVWPRTPLAAATLQLFASQDARADGPLAEATSDRFGRFRIAVAPAWRPPFTLVARAANHATTTLNDVEPGRDVVIRLWEVVPLFGRVRSAFDDAPLASARVSDGTNEALTDAAGNYELLARRMRGQTHLRASHDGFAEHLASVRVHDLRRTQVDIRLQPTVTVPIAIVDAISGAPIADAEVRPSRHGPTLARSDADGTVQVPIAEGQEVRLEFAAPGYCPVTWLWRADELSERRLRIPLTRGVQLAGLVTDARMKPVADAGIRPSYRERPYGDIDLSQIAGRFALPGALRFEIRQLHARSRQDGRYRMLIMPCALEFCVRASHRDYIAAESPMLVADSPGAGITADLQLARGGQIAGSVRCNGEPRRGQVLWRMAGTDTFGGTAWIDAEGNYDLTSVAPGSIELLVRDRTSGRVVQTRTVTVAAGRPQRVDFAWREAAAAITGRITSTTGMPLAGLHLMATSSDALDRQFAQATTDDDGRYSLAVRPPAVFTVRVQRDGIVRERGGVAAGADEVDFVWPDTGLLRLRLVDAATQQPVAPSGDGLWAVAWRESGDEAFQTVRDRLDHTGLLQLKAPVGNVDVSLHLHETGYSPRVAFGLPVTGRTDPDEVRVELTRGVAVTLRLPRAESFEAAREGHLLFLLERSQLQQLRGPFPEQGGPSNHRINGVNMWLGDPGLMAQMPRFDADGSADLAGLQPGRYRLVAFPDDLTFEPAEFAVGPTGATIPLEWRSHH